MSSMNWTNGPDVLIEDDGTVQPEPQDERNKKKISEYAITSLLAAGILSGALNASQVQDPKLLKNDAVDLDKKQEQAADKISPEMQSFLDGRTFSDKSMLDISITGFSETDLLNMSPTETGIATIETAKADSIKKDSFQYAVNGYDRISHKYILNPIIGMDTSTLTLKQGSDFRKGVPANILTPGKIPMEFYLPTGLDDFRNKKYLDLFMDKPAFLPTSYIKVLTKKFQMDAVIAGADLSNINLELNRSLEAEVVVNWNNMETREAVTKAVNTWDVPFAMYPGYFYWTEGKSPAPDKRIKDVKSDIPTEDKVYFDGIEQEIVNGEIIWKISQKSNGFNLTLFDKNIPRDLAGKFKYALNSGSSGDFFYQTYNRTIYHDEIQNKTVDINGKLTADNEGNHISELRTSPKFVDKDDKYEIRINAKPLTSPSSRAKLY